MKIKTFHLLSVVAALLHVQNAEMYASQIFTIEIQRKFSSSDCVSGYLLVNDVVTCYVLERPWQGNAPEISAIPGGRYTAIIRIDGAKGWRIELEDVPQRGNIQIHVGNRPADSKGCLLPGISIDTSLCKVTGSKEGMDRIASALAQFEELNRQSIAKIQVNISDTPGS